MIQHEQEMNNPPLGLCWAQGSNDSWELVDVRDASHRPDEWFKNGEPRVEIFFMGWDCPGHASEYKQFVKADLIDPSGKRYS
jgi:hypothetical protein